MTPVEIARKALHKLAELGLPPTPENYNAQYRITCGMPLGQTGSSTPLADDAERRFAMLRALLQVMTSANADLHADLTRFTDESSNLLKKVEADPGEESIENLFKAMTASSSWLLNEVDQMRSELERTREQLDSITNELQVAQHLAISDALTGLPNRRGFDSTLSREISRARRHKTPLCLAILDLDHFKRINDQFGHVTGDMVLVHFAQTMKSAGRDVDLLARFGGEEFVLLMPDTPLIGAEFGVNRLLRCLEDQPLITQAATIQVRFSAGIAQWGLDETAENLLVRADGALYAAKAAGRGRVAVAASDTDSAADVTQRHKA
ncbi:MAG TPA: GGDEF domain-containing protein [Burkholderiales bacterium]|nr:GGDEF domain-containing protein [Burkholderiales bacterium]